MPAKREQLKPGETLFGGRGVMIVYGNFRKKPQKDPVESDRPTEPADEEDRAKLPSTYDGSDGGGHR